MKILFRTLIFHFLCIFIFFLIYWNLGDHFLRDKSKTQATILDFLLLSTTVQAGVGIADIYPISFMGKLSLIIQQIIMISTHYKMSYYDITLCVLTEIVGDFGYKEFANYGGIKPFLIGSVGYIGVIYFLIRALQGSTILMVNVGWDGISALIESIAAYILLGERLDNLSQYLGIIFIIIGLFLLKIPFKRKKEFKFPSFLK